MNGNSMVLCCLTTTAAILLSLGTAGPQSEAEVVLDEHLFIAGNDHTETAAITYASRLNPHPVTTRFDNFSFPDSCASHPSRCRLLKYVHPSTSNNYAMLFFYVPLTESALGVMQFSYDNTTLHHVKTRAVGMTQSRCHPISVVEVSRTFYLICASDRQRIMSCEVRNAEDISNVWLSCSTPGFPIDVSRLSNFVVYSEFRHRDLYFTHYNGIYRTILTRGSVDLVSQLPSIYSHCRYLELINSLSTPLIACYCYLRSNVNQVQMVYLNLDTYTFIQQQQTSAVVRYDCPSPGTFVAVPNTGSFADFSHRNVYKGSFSITGDSMTFGRCFEFENSTHFIYQDKQRGTFIKPNISVNLQSRIIQLSTLPCQSAACEQPYVFNNQYILLLLENPNDPDWKLELLNISQDIILTLDVAHPAQLALISDFVTHRRPDPPTTTASTPSVAETNSKSATVIGTTSTSGGLLGILLVLSAVIAIVYHQSRQRGLKRRQGTYSSVGARSLNPSRQGSPTPEAVQLKPLSPSNNEQQLLLSQVEVENGGAQNGDHVFSDGSVSSSNAGKEYDNPLDRENHAVVGLSHEDVRGSRKGTQLPQPVATMGSTSTGQQHDGVQPPGTEVSNTISATTSTSVGIGAVPLHSQHSDGSAGDHTMTPDGLVTSPTCTPLSQVTCNTGTRPMSLAVSTHLQQNQAAILTSTPTSADCMHISGVHAHTQAHQHQPMRTNSDDSATSGANSISEGNVQVCNICSVSQSPSLPKASSGLGSHLSVNQNSALFEVGLPLNRKDYSGVGASQENVQRPSQCTQLPGPPPQTMAGYACGQMSNNPRVPYHSQRSDPGSTRSRASTSNDSRALTLYSQHSDDSAASIRSDIPDNSRAVSTSTCTRRRPLSLSSPPFLHDIAHNQATGTGHSPTSTNVSFSGQRWRSRLSSVDSATSYLGTNHLSTPTEHSHQSNTSLTFFSSDVATGGSIVPPTLVTMSAVQNDTGVPS